MSKCSSSTWGSLKSACMYPRGIHRPNWLVDGMNLGYGHGPVAHPQFCWPRNKQGGGGLAALGAFLGAELTQSMSEFAMSCCAPSTIACAYLLQPTFRLTRHMASSRPYAALTPRTPLEHLRLLTQPSFLFKCTFRSVGLCRLLWNT